VVGNAGEPKQKVAELAPRVSSTEEENVDLELLDSTASP
jgi:hypothetical protein